MKIKHYLMAAAIVAAFGTTVTSCSDDNDPSTEQQGGGQGGDDQGNYDMTVQGDVEGVWKKNTLVHVNGHITVPEGKSLTIEDGVQIIFSTEGVGANHVAIEFIVKGNLYCKGTAENPILMSIPEDQRLADNIFKEEHQWGGIVAYPSCEEMLIDHTTIEYTGGQVIEGSPAASAGIYEAGDDAYPQITTNNPNGNYVITNSVIRYGWSDGIYMMGGNGIIANNIFAGNGYDGAESVNIKAGCKVDVAGNIMYAPNTNGLKLSSDGQDDVTRAQGKIKAYMENHINILRETGHTGNANCYAATLNMLEHYDKKFEKRAFSEIDIKYVNGFDVFLQKRGCKGNTRKYYFKALRSILNKAIQEKEATEKTYPFGKGGFQIAKLDEETEKRYLSIESLNRIKNTASNKPQREFARKLFLLSYYCYGISFIDLAYLKRSNIVNLNAGEYIIYKRHKIQHQKGVKPIKIKVTNEIRKLLDDLKGSNPTVDDFIVPIVSISGYTGEKLYNHIRYRYKKYNTYLAELAEELQITDLKLTTYVSRHTMAMMLQRNDVAREQISQMLGHADLKTTNTYLDSFDTTVIDEAAKALYKI